MNKKEEIVKIVEELKDDKITVDEAEQLLLDLFKASKTRWRGYCSSETLTGKRCKELCDKSQCGW
jgi:hypothetical protein